MKFQISSMQGSEVMLCIKKHAMLKFPKLQRAITHVVFLRIYPLLLINTNLFTRFQGSSFNSFFFQIFC